MTRRPVPFQWARLVPHLLVMLVCVAAAYAVVTADGATSRQTVTFRLHKTESVLRFFHNRPWMVANRQEKCWEVAWQPTCRIARGLVAKHTVRRRELQARLEWISVPRGEAALRAYINDDCAEEIIDRETAGTWDPTVENYTDGVAYGLPQARPRYKMASAGADWATNPITQIRWFYSYVNSRYGGSCNALAHHNSQGWY